MAVFCQIEIAGVQLNDLSCLVLTRGLRDGDFFDMLCAVTQTKG